MTDLQSDWGKVGEGDTEALRRLRNHWIDLVSGEAGEPELVTDNTCLQAIDLASLAAQTGGVEDQLMLIVAWQARAARLLEAHTATEKNLRALVQANGSIANIARLAGEAADLVLLLQGYEECIDGVIRRLLQDSSLEGPATILRWLSTAADQGWEKAVPAMQNVIASLSPAAAFAAIGRVRNLEGNAAR